MEATMRSNQATNRNAGAGLPPDSRLYPEMATSAGADPTSNLVGAGALLGLTSRQIEVLAMLAQGRSVNEIASRLAFSASTIKKELHRTLRQMSVRNRTHAVATAIRAGVL